MSVYLAPGLIFDTESECETKTTNSFNQNGKQLDTRTLFSKTHPLYSLILYAQMLILVNLIVVKLFSFFNFTRNGLVRF